MGELLDLGIALLPTASDGPALKLGGSVAAALWEKQMTFSPLCCLLGCTMFVVIHNDTTAQDL